MLCKLRGHKKIKSKTLLPQIVYECDLYSPMLHISYMLKIYELMIYKNDAIIINTFKEILINWTYGEEFIFVDFVVRY